MGGRYCWSWSNNDHSNDTYPKSVLKGALMGPEMTNVIRIAFRGVGSTNMRQR
jgi:hypothetical protein